MAPRDITGIKKRLDEVRASSHINDLFGRRIELDNEFKKPDVWDDAQRASRLSKEIAEVQNTIDSYASACKLYDDVVCAHDLALEDSACEPLLDSLAERLDEELTQLELESWFSGKFDKEDAILTINPGQGGLEAQDWTEMLYKMYAHYCENKGWKYSVLDIVKGERIGLDRVTMQISGHNAYGMLRSEIGVHRLVRISPTDIKKRRHTTFASVEVLPVLPDDIEVDLDMNDVRVDVYRSSGPGGQCVNTTDSAVRLTHIPTGIVVTCQNEKSQLLNKEAALSVLKSKLYEIEELKRREEIDELRGEKQDSSFGSQIRNYVLYPFQLVKDTRTNIETSNTTAVLNGDIDDFVIGYHKYIASL
ncbi:peptide chain release factor 2 [Phoenicibacter congonensis]|uniref:peptide chain release factor 2 n=1 Tax=Phoenicibacter congonensis TaxID=1944646 RepID=UPI0009A915B8|nr:peptide chain release factor 2 [Phoenicibacter congonensis]